MLKYEVMVALNKVAEAKVAWWAANREFNEQSDLLMRRLLNEAAINLMSAEDVARESGLTLARVRRLMRLNSLNPRNGKRLLAEEAAKNLRDNAELMGVEVYDIDLMSPLAYLPAGKKIREDVAASRTAGVTEIPEVHGINYVDHQVGCGHIAYNDPVLITSDLNKITCPGCREVLVRL